MREHRTAQIKDQTWECQALTSIERDCIGESERDLLSMNYDIEILGLKMAVNAGQSDNFLKYSKTQFNVWEMLVGHCTLTDAMASPATTLRIVSTSTEWLYMWRTMTRVFFVSPREGSKLRVSRQSAPTLRVSIWSGIPGSVNELRTSGSESGPSTLLMLSSSSIESVLRYWCESPCNRSMMPELNSSTNSLKGLSIARRAHSTGFARTLDGKTKFIHSSGECVCWRRPRSTSGCPTLSPIESRNAEKSRSSCWRMGAVSHKISKWENTAWVRIEAFAIAVWDPYRTTGATYTGTSWESQGKMSSRKVTYLVKIANSDKHMATPNSMTSRKRERISWSAQSKALKCSTLISSMIWQRAASNSFAWSDFGWTIDIKNGLCSSTGIP